MCGSHGKDEGAAAWADVNSYIADSFRGRIEGMMHGWHTEKGSFTYQYGESAILKVTEKMCNGVTPVVGKTSGSTFNMIPEKHINGTYYAISHITYKGPRTIQQSGSCNNVVIHTPVVNQATISVVEFENQKINIDASKVYLILDGQFTITIPDEGVHNAYRGYSPNGEWRKYNSYQAVPGKQSNWGMMNDVKLPFDAYLVNGSKKVFVKANTWISNVSGISATSSSYTFIVAVWTNEQVYSLANGNPIETRVVAENCPNRNVASYVEYNTGKNGNITHYIAQKTIDVEVIGKIYDLRVSSCDDPGWYNQIISPGYITAENFPFGAQGQNIMSGYKYAPKLGYTFVFDFKTKGRKSNNMDLSVYPEYYFVSKNGGNAEKVDLYYQTAKNQYVKIDESTALVPLNVKLTNPFMKVPTQEMLDSRRIYLKEIGKTYNYTSVVNVGTFAHMLMPHDLRLCYNNFAEYATGAGKGRTIRCNRSSN